MHTNFERVRGNSSKGGSETEKAQEFKGNLKAVWEEGIKNSEVRGGSSESKKEIVIPPSLPLPLSELGHSLHREKGRKKK